MRINFEVTPELEEKLLGIPRGIRSEVFRKVLDIIATSATEHGPAVYGAILGGEFEIVIKEHVAGGAE